MRPRSIYLVRHGQSVGNADKSAYEQFPDYEMPLTTLGEEQAFTAGKNLRAMIDKESSYKLLRAYCSPFVRAKQSLALILESFQDYEVERREEPRIREHEWGTRLSPQGYQFNADKERSVYGKFYYRFDGGESGADVDLRLCSFLDSLYKSFLSADFPPIAILVMHGEAIQLLLRRWMNYSIEEYEQMRKILNGEIIKLNLQPNGKYTEDVPIIPRP